MRTFSSPGMERRNCFLHLGRQRGRKPIGIDGRIVEPFGLEENLVAVAIGEADDLVFDRRAIARPAALDPPGIHRRTMQIVGDDPVRLGGGAGDMAADLRRGDRLWSAPRTAPAASSPGCSSSTEKSMLVPSSRAGVPVLSRPRAAGPELRGASTDRAPASRPARPAGVVSSPRWIRPRRNVPVVSTTALVPNWPTIEQTDAGDGAIGRR